MKNFRFLIYAIIIVCGLAFISSRSNVFTLHDYVEYWAAGRLNLSGQNPYNPELIFALEKTAGWQDPVPLMMWNPPFTLGYIFPFAALPYQPSRLAWFFASLVSLLVFASYAWKRYGGKETQRWAPWVLALSFGPALQLLKLGQIVPVGLLGVLGFQHFYRKKNYLVAGIFISLTLIKPHLFYLLWLALLLWSVEQRQFRLWLGVGLGLLAALAPALATNPALISQYLYAIQYYPPEEWVTATLGSVLRLTFGHDLFWLQFVPSAIGGLFFLLWWRKRRLQDVEAELPFILMASVATSAYGWVFDLSICLIGLIELGAKALHTKPTALLIALYALSAALSIILGFVSLSQHLFWWSGLALLTLYLSTRWALNKAYHNTQVSST